MAQAKTPKVVLVLLDGIPTDVLERVATPAIDAIAAAGGYSHAYVGGKARGDYTETPTVSAPGYMSMITGTWAYKHNVWGNGVKNPNYRYRNVFRMAKEANPELQTAIYSTWEDNRTKLVGEGKPEAGNFKFDYAFDGFENDTSRFPHRADRKFIFNIDERVSRQAARHIRSDAPDLSWVYLQFTDDMGHMFGDSPQMDDAVRKADRQVQRIWDAIQYREQKFAEDWVIIVTTDHGRKPSDGKGHGGQSERERKTWIATSAKSLNPRFTKQTPGIVDITPSALAHLGVTPSDAVRAEMDGTSFLGPVSFSSLQATIKGGKLTVNWQALGTNEEKLQVFMARHNAFNQTGAEQYQLLGEAPVKAGRFSYQLAETPGPVKMLVKGKHNWGNVWIGNARQVSEWISPR